MSEACDPGTGEPLHPPEDLWICQHGRTNCPSQERYCDQCERQAALEDADSLRYRAREAMESAVALAQEAADRIEGWGLRDLQERFRTWADTAEDLGEQLPKLPEEYEP